MILFEHILILRNSYLFCFKSIEQICTEDLFTELFMLVFEKQTF